MNNNPTDSKETTPPVKAIDELYRLRAEHAEHKAMTWQKIADVLMAENNEHAACLREMQRRHNDFKTQIDDNIKRLEAFVGTAEGVCRRALALIDGTSAEDKTEVRKELSALLNSQ